MIPAGCLLWNENPRIFLDLTESNHSTGTRCMVKKTAERQNLKDECLSECQCAMGKTNCDALCVATPVSPTFAASPWTPPTCTKTSGDFALQIGESISNDPYNGNVKIDGVPIIGKRSASVADVVCRTLGLNALEWHEGKARVNRRMKVFDCSGNESSISQCLWNYTTDAAHPLSVRCDPREEFVDLGPGLCTGSVTWSIQGFRSEMDCKLQCLSSRACGGYTFVTSIGCYLWITDSNHIQVGDSAPGAKCMKRDPFGILYRNASVMVPNCTMARDVAVKQGSLRLKAVFWVMFLTVIGLLVHSVRRKIILPPGARRESWQEHRAEMLRCEEMARKARLEMIRSENNLGTETNVADRSSVASC